MLSVSLCGLVMLGSARSQEEDLGGDSEGQATAGHPWASRASVGLIAIPNRSTARPSAISDVVPRSTPGSSPCRALWARWALRRHWEERDWLVATAGQQGPPPVG